MSGLILPSYVGPIELKYARSPSVPTAPIVKTCSPSAGADIYGKALPPSLPADVMHKIPLEQAISEPIVITQVSPSKSE